jgi:hypothetical protein
MVENPQGFETMTESSKIVKRKQFLEKIEGVIS